MKKIIFAVLLAAIIIAGSPLFAQSSEDPDSDLYYVNISLEKIWSYRRGYIVQYSKGLSGYGRAYLPVEWFASSTNEDGVRVPSRAEIITLPAGRAWPSLTVYYRDGRPSHIRLYVHRMQTHQTWGRVPQNVNLDSQFDDAGDIEALEIRR